MKNKLLKSVITGLACVLVFASSKAGIVEFKFCNCNDSCTYVIKLCPQACMFHGGCISLPCQTDSVKPGTCDSMLFNVPTGYILSMSSIVFQVSNLSNSKTWTFGTSTTHSSGTCHSTSFGSTYWTALGGNDYRICDDSTWHSKIVLGLAGVIDESEFKVYPNPTWDVSNVYFALMKDADVNIDVYNMLEQKVFTYQETSAPAGTHSVAINNLKPGIYIVRFTAGGDIVTRKLVVQ